MASLNGVTVVGLVSDEEAFLIPVTLFENMIAYYGEVAYGIEPNDFPEIDEELADYPDDEDDRDPRKLN